MSIALGLTGVPLLSPTGQPLDEQFSFEMQQTFTSQPYTSRRLKMPAYAFPLTPDASPADWEKEDYSCSPTPPGHASAMHPPGAPMYGLGFSQSMFEEGLQTVTIRAPKPVDHDTVGGLPTPHATPALSLPPFTKARPKRSSIALPRAGENLSLFSPGPNQTHFGLQRRRKWTQLYRKFVYMVLFGLIAFTTGTKLARTSWLSDWKKHNAQWSAHVHDTEDKVYGLEEDFIPRYFHRSQRQEYIQYSTRATDTETASPTFDEVEQHIFAEDDLSENQESFFTSSASDLEASAISERIDDLLSLPEVSAYMRGHVGNLRAVYLEGITASVNGLDLLTMYDGAAMVSLLRQLDASRRQFLKTMLRYVSGGGQLPLEWRTATSFEFLMRQIWTISSDQAFTGLFAGWPSDAAVFADDWEERVKEKASVTVFTKRSTPRLLRLQKLLRTYQHLQPIYIDLAERADGPIIESLLHRLTGSDAIPHVLIGFESVGGWNQLMLLHYEGILQKKLDQI